MTASRHGGAREVDIDFSCDPLEEGILVVTITDDGVGLPAHVTAGLGLESVTRSGGTWVLTAAKMPAYWKAIPDEVAQALYNSELGQVPYSQYRQYFE